MRTEKRIRTYKTYNELTDEEKNIQLEKFKKDSDNQNIFYEMRAEDYLMVIAEIFLKINNEKILYGDRDKLKWDSNSQLWYYDRFSYVNDCITPYNITKTIGIYRIDFTGGIYNAESAEEIVYNNVEIYNESKREYTDFDDVKNKKVKAYICRQSELLFNLKEKYRNLIESEIHNYNSYYPTDEELIDDFIYNEREFLTEEKITA